MLTTATRNYVTFLHRIPVFYPYALALKTIPQARPGTTNQGPFRPFARASGGRSRPRTCCSMPAQVLSTAGSKSMARFIGRAGAPRNKGLQHRETETGRLRQRRASQEKTTQSHLLKLTSSTNRTSTIITPSRRAPNVTGATASRRFRPVGPNSTISNSIASADHVFARQSAQLVPGPVRSYASPPAVLWPSTSPELPQ